MVTYTRCGILIAVFIVICLFVLAIVSKNVKNSAINSAATPSQILSMTFIAQDTLIADLHDVSENRVVNVDSVVSSDVQESVID